MSIDRSGLWLALAVVLGLAVRASTAPAATPPVAEAPAIAPAAAPAAAAAPVAAAAPGDHALRYADRDLHVHVPARLPAAGARPLVIVLHGGLGNAERIVAGQVEHGLNLNARADRDGFIVAYLNGTQVARALAADKKGWNAGLCCGLPADSHVDDVGYIVGAVQYLSTLYGIDPSRVYGVGHSNGAMMVQRVMCERGLFARGVSLAGTLELDGSDACAGAHGRTITEFHGAQDTSVPLAGGKGAGVGRAYEKRSQEHARCLFERGGGHYALVVLDDAQHLLDSMAAAVQKRYGATLQEMIARSLGLES